MNKIMFFFVFLQLLAFASEPSVYGAGNLDSANPYGLSPSEKKIVANTKDIKAIRENIRSLQFKYNDLQAKFDGLISVTQSISNKIGKIDNKILSLEGKDNNYSDLVANLSDKLSSLEQNLSDFTNTQSSNQEKVKNVLTELSSLIDSINSSYVSKNEFENFKKSQIDFQQNLEQKLLKSNRTKSTKALSGKQRSELFKEANNFFNKKSYQEAKTRYEKLVQLNYKPARNSFKLGEIAYIQKSYKDAIAYYKKSIALYDKAAYIPTLLYHTGVSLSKLKKNKEASKFFNALKTNYPNSREAKNLKK